MYDIFDVLYYDKMIIPELNKQVLKLYPTPYKIFDDEVNDYVLVDDLFALEKEALENYLLRPDDYKNVINTQKYHDYCSFSGYFVKEYIDTEITIDDANASISVAGRTKLINEVEDNNDFNIKRNFAWVHGAENISGCIKQKTGRKDRFSYFKENKDGSIEVIDLKKYEDGMARPYYTQDEEFTYMWLDHFSGGSGTQVDPYLVSTRLDFENIRFDQYAYYLQTNDIDFGGESNPWPVSFSGSFISIYGQYDGANYKIYNVYASKTVGDSFLLYTIQGVLKNFNLEDSYFYSKDSSCFALIFRPTNDINLNIKLKNCIFLSDKTTTGTTGISSTFRQCSTNVNGFINGITVDTCYFKSRSGGLADGGNASFLLRNLGVASGFTINIKNISIIDSELDFLDNQFNTIGSFINFISLPTNRLGNIFISNSYMLNCKMNMRKSSLFAHAISYPSSTNFKIENFYISVEKGSNALLTYADFQEIQNALNFQNIVCNLYYDNDKFSALPLYLPTTKYKPKTTIEMQQQSTYAGFDFVNVWRYTNVIKYPEYPDLINNPRPTVSMIPEIIRGYLKLDGYYIPYYNFNEFMPPPTRVFKNSSGVVYGFRQDLTSNFLIGGQRTKVLTEPE